MEEFIISARELSFDLIPTLFAILLFCLIVLFIKLIKTVNMLGETLKKTDTTVTLANNSLEKMQKPLDEVVKVSNAFDNACNKANLTIKEVGKTMKTTFRRKENGK